jgi:hypothetical protein
MSDADWDMLLQQVPLPPLPQQQQQQRHHQRQRRHQQQHSLLVHKQRYQQQQQLVGSAWMPPATAAVAAAAKLVALPDPAAAVTAHQCSVTVPQATAAAAGSVTAVGNCSGAAAHGPSSIAGASSFADVLAFIRLSVSHLLQLTVRLMLHSSRSSCVLGDLAAWFTDTQRQLLSTPAKQSTTGQQLDKQQQQLQGSQPALLLLGQLMLLVSHDIRDPAATAARHAGVLVEHSAALDLADRLIAALVSLDNTLVKCGASAADAPSNITRSMLTAWIAELQRSAAHGGAADKTVLQLFSALVVG